MRILHTSDWHLGKRLEHFSRLSEQKDVMEEICDIADREKVHAVIISGDLFDTFNPPTEAIDLFYKTLKKLSADGTRPVIAIAGNHDSPDRIDSPDPLARECGIIFIGYPNAEVKPFALPSGLKILNSDKGFIELQLPTAAEPLRIIHTPYANEFRLKTLLDKEDDEEEMRELLAASWAESADKYCDTRGVNILMSHLFFTKKGEEPSEEPDDEKPILHVGGAQAVFSGNLPGNIQYAALGHLHRMHYVDTNPCPVVYSGSPLSYSFGESNQDKFAVIIDAHAGKEVEVNKIKLTKGKPLLRFRAESVEDAVARFNHHPHTLIELTLVSDEFITAADRKQLHQAHDGIVSIIPEIKINAQNENVSEQLDLSKDMQQLFSDYFKHKHGQAPNERISDLFKEISAEEAKQ